MKKPYRQEHSDDIDSMYELLVGPDGFEACLTEPEDRRWCRDGKPVVDKLNELHAEVERLRTFVQGAMEDIWETGETDHGSLQDRAEALGLIELRPISEELSIDGEREHYFLSWTKP